MSKGKKIVQYTFLIIASLLSVFPLYWMVVSATNKSVDVIKGKLLPGSYLIENFKNLISAHNVGA
ncbi:carbohydrate ABC transporter permease, partial [Rhizobium leguminosarum]